MFRVSNYIDEIRPMPKVTKAPTYDHLYTWFETIEEAQRFCITRNLQKIARLEVELKNAEKHQKVLEKRFADTVLKKCHD
jgi:inorganic pyrophosphatase